MKPDGANLVRGATFDRLHAGTILSQAPASDLIVAWVVGSGQSQSGLKGPKFEKNR